ncbi:MAG: hypothetical protein AB7P24_10430 [Nitrospira sp.]
MLRCLSNRGSLAKLTPCIAFSIFFIVQGEVANAERYSRDIHFTGELVSSDSISGFQGSSFVVGVPDAQGDDDYAVYGIASEEQRDQPCYVKVRSENINDSNRQQDLTKELCDGSPSSKEISAGYGNLNYDKRSFITGVRVCMNKQKDRIKGLQVKGRTISGVGTFDPIHPKDQIKPSDIAPLQPQDERSNCNDWKNWASCPDEHQIATGVILHFGPGKLPRSLIGVGLRCRTVHVPDLSGEEVPPYLY